MPPAAGKPEPVRRAAGAAEASDPEPWGRLLAIVLRSRRKGPAESVGRAEAVVGQGLEGDHFRGLPGGAGTRQVTLIGQGDLAAAAADLERDEPLDPCLTRRNLVVSGSDLAGLRGCCVRLGDEVVLEITGGCPPCDQMDQTVGAGGRSALVRRGGLTARVVAGGTLRVGDALVVDPDGAPGPG